MHSSRTRTAGEVGVGQAIGIGGTLPDRNQPGRSSRANTAQMVRREASQALGMQSFNAHTTSAPALRAAGGFDGSTVAVAGTPSPRRGARNFRLERLRGRRDTWKCSLCSVNAFQIGGKRKQKLIGPIDRICPARATLQMPCRQRVACMLGPADCAKRHVADAVRVLLHRRLQSSERH